MTTCIMGVPVRAGPSPFLAAPYLSRGAAGRAVGALRENKRETLRQATLAGRD